MVDPGNLVKADDTVLTSIVLLDPMYVYFFVDERSMLKFRRLLHAGKVKSAQEAKLPVLLGLSDETGYPHQGIIDFVDNHVDQMTGTLMIRGQFPNTDRLLSPGMFARVRVPVGGPHQALLVAERALGSDQGRRFVYVVDKDNKVVYRPVEVGLLRNGLRSDRQGPFPRGTDRAQRPAAGQAGDGSPAGTRGHDGGGAGRGAAVGSGAGASFRRRGGSGPARQAGQARRRRQDGHPTGRGDERRREKAGQARPHQTPDPRQSRAAEGNPTSLSPQVSRHEIPADCGGVPAAAASRPPSFPPPCFPGFSLIDRSSPPCCRS